MRLSALSRVISQTKALQRCVNHSPDAQAYNAADYPAQQASLDKTRYLYLVIVVTYASAEIDDQIHRLTKMESG